MPETLIRADRLEEWRACRPEGERDLDVVGEIELLMPGVLRLEPEMPGLRSLARRARDSIARDLSAVTVEEFRVYAALRDALGEGNGRAVDSLLEAVDAVIATPRWTRRCEELGLTSAREAVRLRLAAEDAPSGGVRRG